MTLRTTFMAMSATLALGGFGLGTLLWNLHVRWDVDIIMCLILFILAMAVGFAFAQGYRRRLADIEEATTLLGLGRLQYRIATFGKADEVDRLALGFNQMGETLEQQVAQLQALAEENRRLAGDAERAATMEERQRLARDLHDSVSQQLFALAMLAEAAVAHSISNSSEIVGDLSMIAELAHAAQREMRGLLLHLRPIDLEGRSFIEAAGIFLQAVQERHGLVVQFSCRVEADIPPIIEEQLFRILQEAVSNTLKHAVATLLIVQLLEQPAAYEFSVSDDGQGLTSAPKSLTDSYGIRMMRERVGRLGGRLELLARYPGLTVSVVIPRRREN